MTTTALFQAYAAAEAAMIAADYSPASQDAADKAHVAWVQAIGAARAEWKALPAGDRKDSAEQNAHDTEGCDVDELRWFEIALMTYELN